MAPPPEAALANIRRYAQGARARQHRAGEADAAGIEVRLEQTVRELRARVEEQQSALDQLKAQSPGTLEEAAYASTDARRKLVQLRAVKQAYRSLRPTATFLPAPGSLLPALLAAQSLQQNVQGTKAAILQLQAHVTQAEASLQREEANLRDANLLTQAMQNRIERLRAQHHHASQKSPAELARALMQAKRAQKDKYDAEMQRLGEAINDFINDYLAAMIAAEELGGPVVGDMLHVEDDILAAGFTKNGRPKSIQHAVSDKSRQRRIDQIWGANKTAMASAEQEDPPTEAEAADADMRKLIENLFSTLVGPGGGKAYLELGRDSAASRFLVRAKVAQFHPKDARKLRLIDFGRELDD
ncbi:hypothetical protein ACEQ8H_001028 [Pleosporales sp. CAS-2024a]